MNGVYIGEVAHYYNRIGVAVLAIIEPICLGDIVHILGYTSDHRQQVKSLQIELQAVEMANPGQDVALKVDERVRRGDKVYKIEKPA
jgi:translation elongation factor EF-1alpha